MTAYEACRPGKLGMTQNHPIPRFAAVILNGAYRQDGGRQAGLPGVLKPTEAVEKRVSRLLKKSERSG